MIITYECDSCGGQHDRRCLISRCESCVDEICVDCQIKGKDGNYYCEGCIEEANEEYEKDKENKDEEESVF